MIREIVKDTIFLSQQATSATIDDVWIVDDLLDTIKEHADHCVGLAANMIGQNKSIIIVKAGPVFLPMLNPILTKKSTKTYETKEGCLSLPGERIVIRHESIEVRYHDPKFKKQKQRFSGITAEIIQHEIDHCCGILI
jgi:peptide deformylase